MADIRMMSAFGTVPGDAQEGILRVLQHALETVALEDSSFTRAKAVFTESNEQCVFTVELDAAGRRLRPAGARPRAARGRGDGQRTARRS